MPLYVTTRPYFRSIGVLGFDSRRELGISLSTTASGTTLGPTQPPIEWVSGPLSLRLKRPGREADHSPPSTAEVKECVELYIQTPNTPSWRGDQFKKKHRDNFTTNTTNMVAIWTSEVRIMLVPFSLLWRNICSFDGHTWRTAGVRVGEIWFRDRLHTHIPLNLILNLYAENHKRSEGLTCEDVPSPHTDFEVHWGKNSSKLTAL
jgi:hypothetical protein